ncbi:MAG: DUF1501 domain-containing protein [Phycisphaera sp.]|nr:DUF1501 domain-containing protein [Phycisphaera sp.]
MKKIKKQLNRMDEPTRRQVMAGAAGAAFGLSLAPLPFLRDAMAAAPAAKATCKNVIYLFMSGGMSHIDTLDPKPGSGVEGPVKPISAKGGMQLSEYLPNFAKVTDKVTLVRSMTSTQGAHERGQYLMHTNYAPLATIQHPSFGSWVTKLGGRFNKNLPGYVLISGGSRHPRGGFLDSAYSPLDIGNPEAGLQNSSLPKGITQEQFDRRLYLANQFDRGFRAKYPHKQVKGYNDFYDEAVRLMGSEDLKAFDLHQEPQDLRDRYGDERFQQGCILARRLVEHGVRYVEVEFGGWDTHQDNFDNVHDQAEVLDKGLATLLEDLDSRGMLKDTMVVLASEFGRSPKINDRNGRDHHPAAFTTMIAGGGAKRGFVYGESDKTGMHVKDNEVRIPDFNATIATALGLPLDQKIISPSGRPFTIADKGQPVAGLLA